MKKLILLRLKWIQIPRKRHSFFFEVKTRSSSDFETSLEAIGNYKMRTLIKATQFYTMKHPKLPDLMRIDAVSVMLNDEGQLMDRELVKNISG